MSATMMNLPAVNGEKHGLINRIANSVPDNGFKHMSPELKAKAEKERKEDSRIVKGRYINHRGSHERLTKPYCRYAGDTIDTYHLIPNQTYDLPKGFVKEGSHRVKRIGIGLSPRTSTGDRDSCDSCDTQSEKSP